MEKYIPDSMEIEEVKKLYDSNLISTESFREWAKRNYHICTYKNCDKISWLKKYCTLFYHTPKHYKEYRLCQEHFKCMLPGCDIPPTNFKYHGNYLTDVWCQNHAYKCYYDPCQGRKSIFIHDPYCPKHLILCLECKSVVKYEDYIDDEIQYCKEHKNKCGEQPCNVRVDDKWCKKHVHECLENGCVVRVSFSKFCSKHIKKCTTCNKKLNSYDFGRKGGYCEKHSRECKFNNCLNKTLKYLGYCVDHLEKCKLNNCLNRNDTYLYDGYCKDHKHEYKEEMNVEL